MNFNRFCHPMTFIEVENIFVNLQSRFNYCLNDCNQITVESQMHFEIIIYFENNTNVVSYLQREMH